MIIRVGAKGAKGRSYQSTPQMDALPPNGRRVVWNLMNISSFDGDGRLVEEWVRRLQELSPSTWSAGDPVQLNRFGV
jgi:hypothetical protein